MVTEMELFEYTNIRTLWTVIKKQKLLAVNLILILILKKRQIRYRETKNLSQFTINVLKSHGQPHRTSQLVCEDRRSFVSVGLHVSLCSQQHPKCERAIRLLYPHLFSKIRPSSNPTHTNFQRIKTSDSNSSNSVIIHN